LLDQHLWARGYFCASVGAVDEETIRKYIESQEWENPGENFKITAPTEP
ncbi:MAG: transposase, partial [Acidobacteriaceae bacterium]|nr:transposase [Acidobacteriaceae bacterium]